MNYIFPRRLNTRVGFRFHRLVANIIKVSLRIKISGYSLFRGVVSEKDNMFVMLARSSFFEVLRKLVSWHAI